MAKMPADERAISLLLFKPDLASLIEDTEELKAIRALAGRLWFAGQRKN